MCLLVPFAAAAQVNTDLFDTGFQSSTAIGQLEEMSGQSISGSAHNSGTYGSTSGNTNYSSGTTGADAIRGAKAKFKKPSARPKTERAPRPTVAEKKYAQKVKRWNSSSKKTREQAQRYTRTSNFKLKDIRPVTENPSQTPILRMVISNNIPQHITLDYPVHSDTVWSKRPDGTLEGTVRQSKYFAFGAIPGEAGWFNEFRFTNPTDKDVSVKVEYEIKYGKDGVIRSESRIINMPAGRINEPSIYNNSLGVYTDNSIRYRILNVTKL